jgi:hypothetical protein
VQVPAPLQVDASRRVEPEQLCAAHTVPAWYLRQAPAPSQVPSRAQLGAPSSGHSPAGSVPAGTATQRPACPATLHALQRAVQSFSQQNPSAHEPEAHSAALWHPLPFDFLGTQVLPEHQWPAAQSLLLEHELRHAIAPQA